MTDVSADRGLIDFEPQVLRRFIAISAAALVAFGAICWIAANWSAFHRLTKLEMAGGLLAVSALTAIVFARARAPALLVATGAVGALFALIGQTYPSGADAWQLFALWAALALPFAFAARHDAVWSLWVLVVGAAIGLWKAQELPGHALADWAPACAMAVALAVALSPWLPAQRLTGRSVWAFRLAAFGAIAMLGWAGLEEGLLRWRSVDDSVLMMALAALVVICLALAFLRPLELGVLAIATIAVDGLLVFRIARAFDGPRLGSAIVIAFIASGIVALSVLTLREVSRRARGDLSAAGVATDEAHEFSWPLAVLTGFGALIAAVPFLIVYGFLFETLLKSATGSGMLGAVTLVAAVVILRGGQAFGFRQMFGVIAAFVGLALLTQAIGRSFERDAGFALCLIAAATAFAIPSRGARSIFGFLAAGALIFSLFARAGWGHPETGVALTSVVAAFGALALAASALIASADRQKIDAHMRSFALGWTIACLVALVVLAGRPFLLGAGTLVGDLGGLFRTNWRGPAQVASIALAVAGPALLFHRRADFRTPLGFAVVLAGIALAIYAPTLGATVFVLACALLAPSRGARRGDGAGGDLDRQRALLFTRPAAGAEGLHSHRHGRDPRRAGGRHEPSRGPARPCAGARSGRGGPRGARARRQRRDRRNRGPLGGRHSGQRTGNLHRDGPGRSAFADAGRLHDARVRHERAIARPRRQGRNLRAGDARRQVDCEAADHARIGARQWAGPDRRHRPRQGEPLVRRVGRVVLRGRPGARFCRRALRNLPGRPEWTPVADRAGGQGFEKIALIRARANP